MESLNDSIFVYVHIMKNITLLLLLFLAHWTSAQKTQNDKLDQLFDHIESSSEGSGAIAILKNGETIYERGYGNRLYPAQKNNSNTLFRIGSITKTYTSTLIMMAVEEGKIKLSDKLSSYYPDFEQSQEITVENLLRHSSGLFNFTNSPTLPLFMTQEKSKEELLEILKYGNNQFEPGTQHQYSNTNYVLLGFILEDIYQKPYEEILQEKILNPVGLKNTYFGLAIDTLKNQAYSYVKVNGWIRSTNSHMSIPQGAGAITATATEVALFYDALFSGKLLSDKSLNLMTEFEEGFGIGLFPVPYKDKTFIGHNGGIDAFQSIAAYQKEDKLQITLLCNAVNYTKNDILLNVLEILYEDQYTLPKFGDLVTLTDEALNKFTGTYASPSFPLDISITVKEAKLMAQATGQSAFVLTAIDSNTFVFKAAGIELQFDTENDQMTLSQGGRTFTLTR